MSYQFRKFDDQDITKLHAAFLKSFGDYLVTFQPTVAQFKSRIQDKLKISSEHSCIAWHKDEVIGFVLHTINNYQEMRTAYNGGTGVIPEFQRHGIASKLYEQLIQQFEQDDQIDRVLLEVIDSNRPALKFYESFGFQFKRVLKCFKLKTSHKKQDSHINIREKNSPADYNAHFSFLPSFLDAPEHLMHNLKNEVILEAYIDEQLVGHCIFQPELGRISQLAIHPSYRNQNIGKQLVAYTQSSSKVKKLTIMNIPEDEHDTLEALTIMGFDNEIDQYELELII